MISSRELKEISEKERKGKLDSSEQRIYNYYIGSWGI